MCVLHWVVTHFLCQIAHSGPFSAQEKSLSFRLLPLIDLLFSIPPAPTSKFTWFICAHLGWPAARKWEQLYCPNWTEGNWLVSGGDCLDWPVCSRKMLRQHLSTWDSLLIGKWCHRVQVWESGRRRAAWANRKGRSLNVMMLQTAARPSWRIFV